MSGDELQNDMYEQIKTLEAYNDVLHTEVTCLELINKRLVLALNESAETIRIALKELD